MLKMALKWLASACDKNPVLWIYYFSSLSNISSNINILILRLNGQFTYLATFMGLMGEPSNYCSLRNCNGGT